MARKRTTKAPRKKATAASKKKGKSTSRFDRFAAAQRQSVENMAQYSQDLATLVSRGDFSPRSWATQYARMMRSMTDTMVELTRVLLK